MGRQRLQPEPPNCADMKRPPAGVAFSASLQSCDLLQSDDLWNQNAQSDVDPIPFDHCIIHREKDHALLGSRVFRRGHHCCCARLRRSSWRIRRCRANSVLHFPRFPCHLVDRRVGTTGKLKSHKVPGLTGPGTVFVVVNQMGQVSFTYHRLFCPDGAGSQSDVEERMTRKGVLLWN